MNKKAIMERGRVFASLICLGLFIVGFAFLLSVVLPMEGYSFAESIRQIVFEPTTLQTVGWILLLPALLIGTEIICRVKG